MELRVLGVHNLESRGTRLSAHLVDEHLALDAGGLTRSLSLEEQSRVRAVLLTHRHFDHVRDLLPLGLSLRDRGVTVDIYAIEDTAKSVLSHLLDGLLYPDFLSSPSADRPTFRLHTVEPYREFQVLGYRVLAVPVPHSVPAVGYYISDGEADLFYTGDVGQGLETAWEHVAPRTVLAEVTYGDENRAMALKVGHLTPGLLGEALQEFRKRHSFLPRVIVAHMNPLWEEAVRRELSQLAAELGAEVVVADADWRTAL